MENEILKGFNSLASMIAEKVISDIMKELPHLLKEINRKAGIEPSYAKKYIRGNKCLAEWLGVCEWTVCQWKTQGVLDNAIKSEYGKVIIYDTEKVMECLKHKTLKPGRPKLKVS